MPNVAARGAWGGVGSRSPPDKTPTPADAFMIVITCRRNHKRVLVSVKVTLPCSAMLKQTEP